MVFEAKPFLKTAPDKPGVYRMMDAQGVVIYVGKAKSLKKRLTSYFVKHLGSEKTKSLVKNIAHIELIVTATETEALILEHNLIKQYLPRYNVLLRDDKSYPYIFLSNSLHPRLSSHRGAKKKQGDYFGPFPHSGAVKQSLYLLQKIFPVRQCEDSVYANRTRPCLMYQIGRCAGPCVKGLVSDEEYAELVHFTRLFLLGKDRQVLDLLVEKMDKASHEMKYEKAALYRDQIQALRRILEPQYVSQEGQDDLDAIGVFFEGNQACIHVLFLRQGKVLGSRSYFPKVPFNTDLKEVVLSFMGQFYLNQEQERVLPHTLLIEHDFGEDQTQLMAALTAIAGRKVKVQNHPRGARARLLQLAQTNAQSALMRKMNQKMTLSHRFSALSDVLSMETLKRIECFDISHLMGEHSVASCVVFDKEGAIRQAYRRYNITGIQGGDDCAAMAQVLERRYAKQIEPENIPDLILIDGGKGQLNRAWRVVSAFIDAWPKQPMLLGVAKGSTRRAGLETLVTVSGETFHLPFDSPALSLIQQIRDESHDHAIAGHRIKRAKVKQKSILQDIEGVGPKRRQALLKYLGGIQELKRATVDEIAKVPGISKILAQKIHFSLQQL